MRPYDCVEHYELDKHSALEVLAHVELDGCLREIEIISGSDCITIELPAGIDLVKGLVEVLEDLVHRKQRGVEIPEPCPARRPLRPGWVQFCTRKRGHEGPHESDGEQWTEQGGTP